ncbi:MAG: nuclear transport factor 2 family protein [Actinomycetota bacterium]|jgi:ketosteroid isomerase-like protein
MPGPAVDVIRQFGAVEDNQRYTRLVELFAPDAVYYDPFMGPQRGRDAINEFMAHMERVVPAAGVRFSEWEVEADRTVGWARWTMWAPGPAGSDVGVPGQSLYRLNDDGQVIFVADYVSSSAYRKLRPDGPRPDLASAAGLAARPDAVDGPAASVIAEFWRLQDAARYSELGALFAPDSVFTDLIYGQFDGHAAISAYLAQMETEMPKLGARFELVDFAGDETVAWSQWWCHVPNGSIPGWTLHTLRDGLITLDADYFDVVASREFLTP